MTVSPAPVRLIVPGLRPLSALLFALAALVFGGCATEYTVRVRALNTESTAPTGTYRFVNEPNEPEAQKIYRDTVPIMRRALAAKGLREAAPSDRADWRLELYSGFGSPKIRERAEQQPIIVLVPGRTYTETVQTGTTASGQPIYSTVTRQDPPTQEIAGYQNVTTRVNFYTKYVALRGVPASTPVTDKPVSGWAVEARFEEEGKSVSQVLPVLSSAAAVFIGKHLPQGEVIHMKDSDRDVTLARRGE